MSIIERDINEYERSIALNVKYFKGNINFIKIKWKDQKVIILLYYKILKSFHIQKKVLIVKTFFPLVNLK